MSDLRHVGRILGRGVRLRCPRCGVGHLFRGPFTMHPECLACGLSFEREQGYFVGAIYVNYAATVVVVAVGAFAVRHLADLSLAMQLVLAVATAILLPLAFFRHSRSLWMSLDFIFNPPDEPPHGGIGGRP